MHKTEETEQFQTSSFFILNLVCSLLPDFVHSDVFVIGSNSVVKCDWKEKNPLFFPFVLLQVIPRIMRTENFTRFILFLFFSMHNDRVCSHCCQHCCLLWQLRLDTVEALIHVSCKTWEKSTLIIWKISLKLNVESNNFENNQLKLMTYMVHFDLFGAEKSLSAFEKHPCPNADPDFFVYLKTSNYFFCHYMLFTMKTPKSDWVVIPELLWLNTMPLWPNLSGEVSDPSVVIFFFWLWRKCQD